MTHYMDASNVEHDSFNDLVEHLLTRQSCSLRKLCVPKLHAFIPMCGELLLRHGVDVYPVLSKHSRTLIHLGVAFGWSGDILRRAGCDFKLTQHMSSGASEMEVDFTTPGGTIVLWFPEITELSCFSPDVR